MLRNIYLVFVFNFIWALLILMPVIVPFFESRGLSMKNIFELQAIFSFALLIFEVPSGYISDLLGRKKVLILSAIIHGTGFSMFYFTSDFVTLVIAEIFLALAVSLFSGTDVSLIYDSLAASGIQKAPIKIMGRRLFFMQLGETLGGLVGGWLVLWSFNAPVIGQAIVAWLPLIPAFFITEPPRLKMKASQHKQNFIYILRSMTKHSKLLNLIMLTSIFYGVSTLLAVWSFQKYWSELHIPIIYFGYLWAAINFTVAIVGRYAHKFEKKWGSVSIVLIIGVLPIIGYFGMAFNYWIWGIVICLTFQIVRALNSVVITDALNKRISADMRATANSIVSLGVRLLFIIFGPIMGYVIDRKGIHVSYMYLGVIYILCFLFIVVPFLKQKKDFESIT
ncbi:MAG: MFS transporter [Bdellovibrionaceae bacterium]|nr:MFS transporter [Pseudobdellovibrionaceae bacterium]